MSSGGDSNKHREHIGVSQTKQAMKKKSKRPIDPDDIARSISSAPKRISRDTHILVFLFDSSSEQSDAMAGMPPLTQRYMDPEVSPSATTTPSTTLNEMHPLVPVYKDRFGRVMIEPDRSS
ncbi:hypothetical protein EJD97_014348 [Solanum chilense]|uniref:Uncharacterized protein n=1 Tax=Solanum chilense TaxID=4083 RepID=A0A6N2BBH7_SOLCI|nr:hypothetical protein EJD97_014348 [Solanum chilense]